MRYGQSGGRGGGRQEYDNNMQGALFENDRQEKDGDPHMRGECEVDGVAYWMAGWWNKTKAGVEYLKIKLTAKDERGSQRQDTRQPYGQGNRPGNSRGPGARVNPGRRGPNSDQRDDRVPYQGFKDGGRHPNEPGNDNGFDDPNDDIPY